MRQYRQFKGSYPDYILLFRMGDFYEMFYEDARTASRVLGLALTSRSKGPSAVPLAGIPYHALDSYLAKLIAAGHRVAICEQVEDPKLAKGLVKRDITRLVTPGTLTEENLLDRREGNYLAAVFGSTAVSAVKSNAGTSVGIAWVELSSGQFQAMLAPGDHVLDELVRIRPAEVVVPEGSAFEAPGFRDGLRQCLPAAVTVRPPWAFDAHSAMQLLNEHFHTKTLSGFGFDGYDPSLSAAGAIIDYLRETQKTQLEHILSLRRFDRADCVILDGNTLRCLEILRTLRTGRRTGTLLEAVDATATGMGSRLLERWLTYPLRSYSAIVARQDAVEELSSEPARLARLRELLADMAQIDRIASNIAMSRVRPRELLALGQTLARLPEVVKLLGQGACRDAGVSPACDKAANQRGRDARDTPQSWQPCASELVGQLLPKLAHLEAPAELVARAICPDCRPLLREGGVIADGFDEELDRLRRVTSDGESWLADYQAREVRRTGIGSLKVGYNKVFGYYLEVSHVNAEKVPADFVRRQTLKNAERYITDELKRYEAEALTAGERARAMEEKLFEQVRAELAQHTAAFQAAAEALATIDVLASFAHLAVERRYHRPTLTQDNVLHIVAGRHPVLEPVLREKFVPNDVHMDAADNRLLLITGPNMAGKSTYIRQVAILTLLAQTGSFLPAEEATIGIVDRIFTRIGASDELTAGLSTFMVEMIETANILNNATARSLVILDEVGRGTSTYDGLALAWAICEHIALRIKCRTLFATHYHELTELESLLDGTSNLNVTVREWADEVVFLYKIAPGSTDRSYGVHVARLAGVPKEVLARAREILPQLQAHLAEGLDMPQLAARAKAAAAQMNLFASNADRLARDLKAADLDNLTPIQAMELLRKLKSEL